MRFVKASERLPEDFAKGYYLRFITPGSFGCLAVGLFYKNELNETVIKFYSGTNGECGRDEVEWLDESLPASIEDEAEKAYPLVTMKESEKHSFTLNQMNLSQQAAHITCARQYMGEIEKLRAENERMRNALESIRDGFDHENDAHKYQNLGACPVCIATSALKTVP